MSRSYKKNPFCNLTYLKQKEKSKSKRIANREFRRISKQNNFEVYYDLTFHKKYMNLSHKIDLMSSYCDKNDFINLIDFYKLCVRK